MPRLSPSEISKIEAIFSSRSRMRSLSVLTGSSLIPQVAASLDRIFTLGMSSYDEYVLSPTQIGGNAPDAHGTFCFVILRDQPGVVYCGVDGRRGGEFKVAGHTSISLKADVYYAGELFFHNKQLTKWTNGSGHYQPPRSLMETNLLPFVQRMLPSYKFSPVYEDKVLKFDKSGYVAM